MNNMQDDKVRVLILDGLWRKSLSALRSLNSTRYECAVESSELLSPTFASLLTKKRLITTTNNRWNRINDFLAKRFEITGKKTILIPMEDVSMKWVIDNKKSLESYSEFLVPSKKSFTIANDKYQLMQLAAKLSIPHPTTFALPPKADLRAVLEDLRSSGFVEKDWVIKPKVSSGSRGVVYSDASDLSKLNLLAHSDSFGELIIQKKIPREGITVGVCLLYDKKHECKANFVYQRVYEYPTTGGPSTQRISVTNHDLLEKSCKILEELHWTGVAMLEWKFDRERNEFLLLEINPRFWGSLDLSHKSGVNFPEIYAEVLRQPDQKFPTSYELGVKSRWLIPGDILRYLSTPKTRRESIRDFLKGLVKESEELSEEDLLGSFAAVLFPLLLAFKPRYWIFLRR